MSLKNIILKEDFYDSDYVNLEEYNGTWTTPLNYDVLDYISQIDYTESLFKKDTISVDTLKKFKLIPSHELYKERFDIFDYEILNGLLLNYNRDEFKSIDDLKNSPYHSKNFKKGINEFIKKYPHFSKKIGDVLFNNNKKFMQLDLPIIASIKHKKILFDNSIFLFYLYLATREISNNSFNISVINIDHTYSMIDKDNPVKISPTTDIK